MMVNLIVSYSHVFKGHFYKVLNSKSEVWTMKLIISRLLPTKLTQCVSITTQDKSESQT